MTLRVAFIGAGAMARNHADAIRRAGLAATIVGVHDPCIDRADAFAAHAATQTYPSVSAMLAGARPDVVHVCTPPAAHAAGAHEALDAGAHVYVEKPFALTGIDALRLLDLAERRQRLVCAGHQLLFDPAFTRLVERGAALGEIVQVDSHFAFHPSCPAAQRAGARARAAQLLDILPHPLYSLMAVLERFGPPGAAVGIDWVRGGPADLHATLRAGEIVGRLSVSLRARPVASSLTITGTRGALTCDFVRSIVVGAANPGVAALEKVLNPMVEAMQLAGRTAHSVARRVVTGVSYPGLAELIGAFYQAIERNTPSPVAPRHLLSVATIFETLAAAVGEGTAPQPKVARARARASAPLVVVTGARGFLGGEIARALDGVRGIGRGANHDDPHVREWVVADLSRGVSPEAFAGADVVVHAAAETAGDFAAHQRNTIDATRHLLRAMRDAGVSRLVLVSSLSVLRPPRTPWERQNEQTPRPDDPVRFGPYVWGKSLQEALVEQEAPALGIAVRIIRPGALIDADDPSLPGLMGRHLFGRWHLGLGRPGLPIAVCEVRRCADAIAWCATHFDEAPPIVNLFEPELTTRGAFLRHLRSRGWAGRVVWVPISTISFAVVAARAVQSGLRGRMPVRLAAWSVLKPRRYDAQVAAKVLAACR
jgi:predicted dehydrogenase/nucleoside-diphosphate-sugar epimerase